MYQAERDTRADRGKHPDLLTVKELIERKLAGVDINLIVALDALLACKNVTLAARLTGQTQPAMSRTLARLRDLLGDELLVRGSGGLQLTTRAEYLAEMLPMTMSQLRNLLAARKTRAGIRISINVNLMPALLPHFAKSASLGNNRLKVASHKTVKEGLTQLRSRTVDYMLGISTELDAEFASEVFCREDFVTLVAFEYHRLGGARPSKDAFLSMRHINLIDNGDEIFPQVADALAGCGIHRSTLCEVPDAASAALMVSHGGLALTVPRSMAGWLTRTLRLAALLPPIHVSRYEIEMIWLGGPDNPNDPSVIDEIGAATREAIAQDQAAVRVVRPVSVEEQP